MTIERITPFLWYDTQAEDAAKLYVSSSTIDAVGHGIQPVGDQGAPGPTRPAGQIRETVVGGLTLELGHALVGVVLDEAGLQRHDRPLLPGQT